MSNIGSIVQFYAPISHRHRKCVRNLGTETDSERQARKKINLERKKRTKRGIIFRYRNGILAKNLLPRLQERRFSIMEATMQVRSENGEKPHKVITFRMRRDSKYGNARLQKELEKYFVHLTSHPWANAVGIYSSSKKESGTIELLFIFHGMCLRGMKNRHVREENDWGVSRAMLKKC